MMNEQTEFSIDPNAEVILTKDDCPRKVGATSVCRYRTTIGEICSLPMNVLTSYFLIACGMGDTEVETRSVVYSEQCPNDRRG